MGTSLRLLLVEDSKADADLLQHVISRGGYDVHSQRVDTSEAMKSALMQETWDIVVSDYTMRGFTGMDALTILKESGKDIPFILVSGTAGEDIAVAAMRAGASDFFSKTKIKQLLPAVQRELRVAASRGESREKDVQLRQAQKMEMIGQLAGGVAHDFNNLLAVISLYSEMIVDELKEGDHLHEAMGHVLKATERGASLTRQLLLFSRKQRVELRLLDLNEVVTGLGMMLRRLIGEDVELAIELSSTPQLIKADSGQLEQAIMNLVVNARDAIATTGKIVIRTGSVKNDKGSFVRLCVVDSGTGMDEKTKLRIFDPFFTTKEVGKGTGLGLSIVYAVMKEFNGSVSVESELGKGTTFELLFERQDGIPDVQKASPPKTTSIPDAISVLLVEDEEPLRLILTKMLQKKGYLVLSASHGREALSLLQTHGKAVDLIVTDVVMPEMGGRELVEQIRSLVPSSKVLYISGYLDDKLLKYGVSSSETFFMDKPFKIQLFLNKVAEVLGA